jgi:4-hydroxybenzoate polyprenyltransferase
LALRLAIFLLVLSSVCIAAGGYVINAIFDQGADAINKPSIVGKSISESQAYNLYGTYNCWCRNRFLSFKM